MSYQVQKNIVNLVSTTLIFGGYCWYMLYDQSRAFLTSPEAMSFWGKLILVLIPVSIVAKIVISILHSIGYRIATREEEPSFADELDKLISLKSTRNSHYAFVVGFLLAMLALTFAPNPMWIFPILLSAGFLSEVVDACSQLYWYRNGV